MKGDNPPNNKIIPIQSLVENYRQQQKRHAHQSSSKGILQVDEIPETFSHTQQKGREYISSTRIPQQITQPHNSIKVDKLRGATIKKGFASMNLIADNEPLLPVNVQINYEFEEHHYPKTQRSSRPELSNPMKEKKLLLESHKKQSITALTPKSIQKDPEELTFMKERFKSVALPRGSSDIEKLGSIASDLGHKLEDQKWNASKFQRTQNSSRQMQPIYKNELVKIKTQLFQKQACLFQLTQKLQQKQTVIKDLTYKLQMASNRYQSQGSYQTDDNVRLIINRQTKKLNQRIRELEEEAVQNKNEIRKNKESFEDEEERSETSKKLMLLKLKQFEIEGREKSQLILQLKEKQKKIIQNSEKITNAQQELLRQKQEQIIKISQAAQFYKQQLEKTLRENQDTILKQSQSDTRKIIIEELSGEMSEVKNNLQQLQIRMREMIQNQQQLKKQLESNRQLIQLFKSRNEALQVQIQGLNNIMIQKDEALSLTKSKNDDLSLRVSQLEEQLCQNKAQLEEIQSLCTSKDFQLSLMTKTCEDYKKKISEYHHFSEQMRLQIECYQKKQIVDKNNFTSPKKQWSPSKDGKADDKETQLKQLNGKLTKQIERLNLIIRNLNISVYQFYKVNKGLNEVIVQNQLHRLNSRLSQQMETDN